MNRDNLTPEEQERILSNEYADLIINYSGNLSALEQFPDSTVNIINFFNAVIHVPVSQVTDNIIVNMGYAVMPTLFGPITQASLEASGVNRIRSIPNFNLRGQGVIIGIIDTGIDYTNPIFRYADGTTKIVGIWDQTIINGKPPAVGGYGAEYTREQINAALKSENPLEIVPTNDNNGHGTMVAGISAGNEVPGNDFFGVAPDAELLIVKLKPAKDYLKRFFRVPQETLCFQENDILFGLEYLNSIAVQIERPLIICIAVGSSQGGHDGRGTLSGLLSLQAEREGTCVVVAAGNEGNARRHYYGEVDINTGFDTVELNIGENEQGFSMELWANSPNIFSIDILSPSGAYIPRTGARLDENREISFIFEGTTILIDFQTVESQAGDQLILMRFTEPSPGIWQFRVYGRNQGVQGFNIWLPMEGFISADTFFIASNPYTTILTLGNARVPITVTAYNTVDDSLYMNASRGYTRNGVIKPDIAAPGINITSPTLDQSFTTVTGTSAAAAHVAGIAAMLMEWGMIKGNIPGMSTIHIKILLIRGALRNPNTIYPNSDWGYGILDVFNTYNTIRTFSQ